jgi:hypothetical protein
MSIDQETSECIHSSITFFFIVLLFICAYKAWVISPPCPHPLPYHPLRPLPLPLNHLLIPYHEPDTGLGTGKTTVSTLVLTTTVTVRTMANV